MYFVSDFMKNSLEDYKNNVKKRNADALICYFDIKPMIKPGTANLRYFLFMFPTIICKAANLKLKHNILPVTKK